MSFPVRNLRFALENEVPRHWLGGRRAVTLFFDNLSIFFPPGERFFVASVNHYKERLRGDQLRAEVKAFCAQEGFHSREHVRYNRMLEAQGYPALALERRVERILAWVTRVLPPRGRLAVTCALEHFTATLAHGVLSDPRLLDGAHPTMTALWKWHAAEENEHKGVAFDVYREVGGTFVGRVVVMALATVVFWTLVIEQQVRLMAADGILGAPREWWALFRYLWIEPGALTTMWRLYVDYFRPGFHPWQLDNRALLEAWRREYADAHLPPS
jgi:predicted metal-dependent hydrolase